MPKYTILLFCADLSAHPDLDNIVCPNLTIPMPPTSPPTPVVTGKPGQPGPRGPAVSMQTTSAMVT